MISKYYDDGILIPYEVIEELMIQCREEVLVELVKKASQKIDDDIARMIMTPEPRRLGVNNV